MPHHQARNWNQLHAREKQKHRRSEACYPSLLSMLWLCSWRTILLGGTESISFQTLFRALVWLMIDSVLMNYWQWVYSPVCSEADFLLCRTAAGSDMMRKWLWLVAWIIQGFFHSNISSSFSSTRERESLHFSSITCSLPFFGAAFSVFSFTAGSVGTNTTDSNV